MSFIEEDQFEAYLNESQAEYEELIKEQLDVSIKDTADQEQKHKVDVKDEEAPYKLMEIQENILNNIENTKSVSINSGEENLVNIDLSPLAKFEVQINETKQQIEKIEKMTEQMEKVQELTQKYAELQDSYKSKLNKFEDTINEKFGIVNNDLQKTQGKESKIKPSIFRKVLKKKPKAIKDFVKTKYNKIFKKSPNLSAIQEQQLNNAVYNKMKIREAMLKQLSSGHNSTTNPDKLAEDLIMSLFMPVKAFTVAKQKQKQEDDINAKYSSQKKIPKVEKESTSKIILDGKEYKFEGYINDKVDIKLSNAEGKKFTLKNDRPFSLKTDQKFDLTKNQEELLAKGKSIMIIDSEKNPLKIKQNSEDSSKIDVLTMSKNEYSKVVKTEDTLSNDIKQKTKAPKIS